MINISNIEGRLDSFIDPETSVAASYLQKRFSTRPNRNNPDNLRLPLATFTGLFFQDAAAEAMKAAMPGMLVIGEFSLYPHLKGVKSKDIKGVSDTSFHYKNTQYPFPDILAFQPLGSGSYQLAQMFEVKLEIPRPRDVIKNVLFGKNPRPLIPDYYRRFIKLIMDNNFRGILESAIQNIQPRFAIDTSNLNPQNDEFYTIIKPSNESGVNKFKEGRLKLGYTRQELLDRTRQVMEIYINNLQSR